MNWTIVTDWVYAQTEGASTLGSYFSAEVTRFLFMGVALILILIAVKLYSNKLFSTVKSEGIDWEQKDWVRRGAPTARKKKLRYLFTSVGGDKTVKVGSIVSYISLQDDQALIGVKRMFDYDFYLVDEKEIRINQGDITLNDWNYIKADKYYVKNTSVVNNLFPKKEADLASLKDLSRFTLDAIKSNPFHRIKLRERGLANAPDDYNYRFEQQG